MQLNPIALSIPVFLAAVGLELWVARRRGRQVFRFTDAITNLSCGIGNQAVSLVSTAALLSTYGVVHQKWSLVHFAPGSVWPWVIGFLGVDFLYYWWHRLSHEVNVLWAIHVVHHQSEDYNLAVALRQPYFSGFSLFVFYLPLALLGVPTLIYATHAALSLLYQFWIHTELIDRLPAPLEAVLNTPSHHRVHHGINPEYLDRNYGAVLIVWDRLFGTFQPERAAPVFGVTKPVRSFNPLWVNLETFVEIGKGGLLRTALRPPGWDPVSGQVVQPPRVARETFVKHDAPAVGRGVQLWVAAQLALVSFGLMALLLWTPLLSPWVLWAGAGLILCATLGWAGLLESRRWAWPLESVRLLATVALVGSLFVA